MTEFASLETGQLARAAELLEKGVEQRAFPGAVLAVGHQGRLAILPAGRLSWAGPGCLIGPGMMMRLSAMFTAL